MPPKGGPTPGFVVKVLCTNGEKVFINVCGHPGIGRPQGASGTEVDGAYIDDKGCDNLQIPIAVDEVKRGKANSGDAAHVVNVVVDIALTSRCVAGHHQNEHLRARLTQLAVHWVQQETGLQLNLMSAKPLTNATYKNPDEKDPGFTKPPKELLEDPEKMMKWLSENMEKVPPGEKGSDAPAAEEREKSVFELPTPSESTKAKRSMVQEMPATKGVKKGFLNDPGRKSLYGAEGTKEGVLPEGAGDPLGYIPKSLREKCKIIDTRNQDATPESVAKVSALGTPTPPPPAPAKVQPSQPAAGATRIAIEEGADEEEATPAPTWVSASVERGDGADGPQVRVAFTLPEDVTTMAHLDLEVEERSLVLRHVGPPAAGGRSPYTVALPARIDMDQAAAKFLRKKGQLVVTAPIQ